jgi:GNAT superfamily N-acetyltransferase
MVGRPTEPPRTYWRVPFEWPGDRRVRRVPDSPLVTWQGAAECPDLAQLVGTVLANSVDASDQAAVEALGPEGAAKRILSPPQGFSYRQEWWQLLMYGDVAAGFVLPVIFDGCARDGLDEATIYHMGVVPSYRGRGLARLLLRKATHTLVDHGVWRIHCDTAAANAPMIHLFESEGWTRLPAEQQPVSAPADPSGGGIRGRGAEGALPQRIHGRVRQRGQPTGKDASSR